jgi:hypothetical protein
VFAGGKTESHPPETRQTEESIGCKHRHMEADDIRIVNAEAMNECQIVVDFTDGTTAVISVEQLLAAAPDRVDSDDGKSGK